MVGFQDHAVFDLDDRHLRGFGEELVQDAFMVGIKVLDYYERHSGVDREGLEQRRAGFQAPGGGADPDYRKLRSGACAGGFAFSTRSASRA
jgi:hypothetical protein